MKEIFWYFPCTNTHPHSLHITIIHTLKHIMTLCLSLLLQCSLLLYVSYEVFFFTSQMMTQSPKCPVEVQALWTGGTLRRALEKQQKREQSVR